MFSFVGDTVFDPFLGTGTTTVAAMRSGRNSIGCEIDSTYAKLAEKRIAGQKDFFTPAKVTIQCGIRSKNG